jgi:CheY-like chemotaxis protein
LRASHEAVSRLELPAEARPLLHAGRQAAEEAEAILADMRDVAGLEAGILTVEEADIDLPAALEDCVAAVRGAALAKEVPLHLAADPGLPRWIRGDPRRLRRVLTGMLREAVASASAGEVTLSARLAPQPGSVEILVSDAAAPGTGGGRPPSALCRLLAAAMGGGLTTEEAGRLVLRLPFRPGAPPAPPGRGLRVLVAEDVAAARLLLTAVLERGGHRVTATEDGARALAALHGGSFDMLILDLHMPGMDGCGVAAAVRAMPGETGRVPILALTADPPEEVEAGCREAGFDAVLRKPFETRRLLGVVEALRGRTDGVAREASRMAAG